ncbi:MAG: xanthine dehydrogenase family protein subunit M [Gemmatimonadota bacterium]|nr:xanthine dehydrogenase family protein subunit M [Gemmatimonadota bacterium]
MKPAPFDYLSPRTLDEALRMLAGAGDDARPLAGGQSLIPMLNFRLASPTALVDLGRVDELAGVTHRDEGGLTIGAMTTQRVLERHPDVALRAPLLAEGAPWIAHVQIRTRGTVGGSIAHADPAAELPALLLVLGAAVRVSRAPREGEPEGRIERTIRLADLFLGPFFTALEPDELITAIDVPPPGGREGCAFDEVARRRGDYAIAGVAARVRLDGQGACESVALAAVNAGPAPMLLREAAAELVGVPPLPDAIDRAATTATAECDPAPDMHASEAYRRHLVGVLAARTLTTAARRAAVEDGS